MKLEINDSASLQWLIKVQSWWFAVPHQEFDRRVVIIPVLRIMYTTLQQKNSPYIFVISGDQTMNFSQNLGVVFVSFLFKENRNHWELFFWLKKGGQSEEVY